MSSDRETARYPYRNERSNLLFELVRYTPKRFEARDPEGKVLSDIPHRILYRLPELLAAEPSQTVFVVEGEKDVETLRAEGLIATCNPGGAKLGWHSTYTDYLTDHHIVILPDCDGPGTRLAEQIAGALGPVAASLVVVLLPKLRPPEDVTDWLTAHGGSPERLLELVTAARYAAAGLNLRRDVGTRHELIFTSPVLTPSERVLLLALDHRWQHVPHLPTDRVTARSLARDTGRNRVTVQNLLTDLRERGLVSGYSVVWELVAATGRGYSGPWMPAPKKPRQHSGFAAMDAGAESTCDEDMDPFDRWRRPRWRGYRRRRR